MSGNKRSYSARVRPYHKNWLLKSTLKHTIPARRGVTVSKETSVRSDVSTESKQ